MAKAKTAKTKQPALEAAATPTAAQRAEPQGKLGVLAALLRRPEGASIGEMSEASGWQAHSVRGALSGGLKRKHGLAVSSEKTETGRVYRIAGEAA